MAISTAARSVIIATTTALTLSDFFTAVTQKFSIVPAQSEFFAYSWIYALRWSAGEFPFQPTCQILYPILALLDKIFTVTNGTASQIFLAWDIVTFAWTFSLAIASLILIYLSMKTNDLLEYAFVSIVFVVAVPLSLSELALFSLAYHSLAVPIAFLALPLWTYYVKSIEKGRPVPLIFCALLAGYVAVCILAKPTFIAYAVPFFVAEAIRSVENKKLAILVRIAVSALIAAAFYLLYLLFFYRSFDGVIDHFKNTALFMTSQANWYDTAKGSNWIDWYISYVIKVAGPFATAASSFILICALVPGLRRNITFATCIGAISSMFFLYNRSQSHGHPEFFSSLAVLTIVNFRHGGVHELLKRRSVSTAWNGVGAIAIIFLSFLSLLILFPLPLNAEGWTKTMVANNKLIAPIAFSDDSRVKTLIISVYPRVLFGVTDAVCRGSSNIFDTYRSPVIEQKFGNFVCLTGKTQQIKEIDTFNQIVFRKEVEDKTIETAAERVQQDFSFLYHRLSDCSLVGTISDQAELVRCKLTKFSVD
jgi:hypothetical protein